MLLLSPLTLVPAPSEGYIAALTFHTPHFTFYICTRKREAAFLNANMYDKQEDTSLEVTRHTPSSLALWKLQPTPGGNDCFRTLLLSLSLSLLAHQKHQLNSLSLRVLLHDTQIGAENLKSEYFQLKWDFSIGGLILTDKTLKKK